MWLQQVALVVVDAALYRATIASPAAMPSSMKKAIGAKASTKGVVAKAKQGKKGVGRKVASAKSKSFGRKGSSAKSKGFGRGVASAKSVKAPEDLIYENYVWSLLNGDTLTGEFLNFRGTTLHAQIASARPQRSTRKNPKDGGSPLSGWASHP